MRRKKYSVNIADYIGGTRGLSDRAYRLLHELCLLIAEAGGRLALKTEADETDARKRLGCDRRKWFAALKELMAGERPKLRRIDGWLVNKRTLVECDVLLVAIEVWGWSEGRLVSEIGVDPRDIEAARRRRQQASDHGDKPVDRGDKGGSGGSGQAASNDRSAASRPEVPGKSRGSLVERVAEFVTYQRVTPFGRFPLLSSCLHEGIDRPSPVPRARGSDGRSRKPLGEVATGPPRATGFSWARPETAQSKLWLALIASGMDPTEALALIERASDPEDPGFGEASQQCGRVSYVHRCGWYPPRRLVH